MLSKTKKSLKTACLGIDIGTQSIKLLEVSSGNAKYKLSKLALKELPAEPTEEHADSALKAVLEEAKPSTRDAHISLSGANITVRFISMPQMSKEDLKNSLKFEADKYIPFNIDEVVVDSYILEKPEEKNAQMRVLLAAAKKEIINKRVEAFKTLGYNVKLIDVDAFAAFNAFQATQKEQDGQKSIALLNMGHSYTNVIVSRGASPYFTRDVRIGGKELDAAIARQFNIAAGEAAKLKAEPGDKSGEVLESIKAVLNGLIDEIRLSFGYYENQYGKSIDEIYISGGLFGMKNLMKYFEEHMGIIPKAWDPLQNFDVDEKFDKSFLDKIKPSLAVSSGLAIRAIT